MINSILPLSQSIAGSGLLQSKEYGLISLVFENINFTFNNELCGNAGVSSIFNTKTDKCEYVNK